MFKTNTDVEARPVFARWQVHCKTCGVYFYVDAEPDTSKEDLINLEELKCGEHPMEDQVLEMA